jgi:hypothetical protein
MAGSQEFLDYPKGRFSVGGGDLIDVYDVQVQYEDGETLVSTLRNNPAGSTHGKRAMRITFKSAIGEEGFERDFWGHYRKRKVVQGRLKVPGKTFVCTGRYTQPNIASNVDNFIDFGITLAGKGNEENG